MEREYYVNDHGGQIQRFGASIKARATGEEPPEDGYQGLYVAEIADGIPGAADLDEPELARLGVEAMLEGVRATLERFRVRMERFSHESENHESGAVTRVLDVARGAAGTSTRTRARCGCARPPSATTRTACSSAPTAS